MDINASENSRPQSQAFDGIFQAFHGGFQGWVGEFLRNLCKHNMGTILVVLSVEMSRRKPATKFPLANTLLLIVSLQDCSR